MLKFTSAVLCAILLQSASVPQVDLNAVTTRISTLVNAINEKDYTKAAFQISPLVDKYVELGDAITAADAAKDAPSHDFAAECRKSRKQIVENLSRVVKEPRAPVNLQQRVLATFGAQPDEGEKLALAALALDHITAIPESQAAAVKSLGTLRRTKYIEVFEKQLGDTRAAVLDAAAHSMGEYFGEKEELRKRLVGKLILAYESAGTGQNPSSTGGPRRIVVDPLIITQIHHEFCVALARLTGGVQFDTAKAWGDWYRDAKSTKWKDGVDKVSVKADGPECPYPGKSVKPEKH
jgi:hypothetical protein